MCFYYAMTLTNPKSLIEHKIIKESQLSLFDENTKYIVSGFNHPRLPIITNEKPEEVQMSYWGFVAEYTNSKAKANEFLKKYNTLNAKAETIFESKLYKEAIMNKRCLVLCSGFFEWRHRKVPGKPKPEKYPFYISLKDNQMFVFAGVWSTFSDKETGEIFNTYSIITTESNSLMSLVHNSKKRMPLILPPEKALDWLQEGLSENEIKSFLVPFDATKMVAKPIRKINPFVLDQFNTPELTAYYHYPEIVELLEEHESFIKE